MRSKNYILYLDTSELTATVAVYADEKLISEEKWEAGRELTKTLSQKYTDILKASGINDEQLSGLCVFVGPGSFTGLRIGLAFANGLAFALSIPIYETKKQGTLNLSEPKELALPLYGAEPNITQPKKK